MKERLSGRRTASEKIALTIGLFFVLSLPTPFGLLNFILIQSDHLIFILFQRLIHFLLIFFFVKRLVRDSLLLEYDSETLFINDKEVETRIPLEQVYNLELKPKYIDFNEHSYKFTLSYLDESDTLREVTFSAYPGKRLNQFVDRVKKLNEEFKLKNWTFS
jgi:hypothetical protein